MTNITVTNTYQDSLGLGLAGTVTFTPVVTADDGGSITFIDDPIGARVTAGDLLVSLVTTDSFDVNGTVTYRVVERIGTSHRRRYYVELDSALGASVVLSSLTTYTNPPNTLVIEGFGDVSTAITDLDSRVGVLESLGAGDLATHEAAADPHADYLLQAEADALYPTIGTQVPLGGTTGQVLAKNSATDNDVDWVNQTATAITSPFVVTADAVGEVPITAQGMAGQTADVFQAKLDGGTQVIAATAGGQVEVGNSPPADGSLRVEQRAVGERAVKVKLKTSATADAIQVVDNADAELMSVGADGIITAPNIGNPVLILDNAASVPSGTLEGTLIVRRPA
jgi:hypothetical protein